MRITRSTVLALVLTGLLGCGRETLAPKTGAHDQGPEARNASERAVQDETRQILANSGPLTEVAAAAIQFQVAADVFGTPTPIDNRLFYVAARRASDPVNGIFSYTQTIGGVAAQFSGIVTCMHLYDFDGGTHNRAKIGGLIQHSNDPGHPAGTYIWWQQIDNAASPGNLPDKSTLSGFGDEAANENFCNIANPPRFGPFAVDRGDIVVRDLTLRHEGGRITP